MFDSDYLEYQLNRNPIRKFIRHFYLNNVLKYVLGKTVDLGCGAGELLGKLPTGSIGLEINPAAVKHCCNNGLEAILYNPEQDNYSFSEIPEGEFNTLIFSHVLEHLDHPENVLKKILQSCERLKLKRVIIIVPGLKGFKYDSTHKNYINRAYLQEHQLEKIGNFTVTQLQYFPFNHEIVGTWFTHNEMMVIYDHDVN